MNKSTRRGAQFVQIAIPTVCWKHVLQTYQIWAFWWCQFQRIFVVESVFFSFKTDLWLSKNPCKCHRGICRFAKWIVDNQFIYQAVYERRVWRYQRGNQNPYIEEEHTTQWPKEEEQTTQWPKEKAEKDKQRSTKHTHKTKNRVTRTPLRTGGWTQVLQNGKQFRSTIVRRIVDRDNNIFVMEVTGVYQHLVL